MTYLPKRKGEQATALESIPVSELVTQLKRCKKSENNPLSYPIIVNKLLGKNKKIDEKKLKKLLRKQSS